MNEDQDQGQESRFGEILALALFAVSMVVVTTVFSYILFPGGTLWDNDGTGIAIAVASLLIYPILKRQARR